MADKKKRNYNPAKYDTEWNSKRAQIIRRDDYKCVRCGKHKDQETLTVHHIKSRAKGGGDYSSNLVTLCSACHNYVEIRDLLTIADIMGSFPGDTVVIPAESNIKSVYSDVAYRPGWSKGKGKSISNKPDFQRLYGPIYELSQLSVQGYKMANVNLYGKLFGITVKKREQNQA